MFSPVSCSQMHITRRCLSCFWVLVPWGSGLCCRRFKITCSLCIIRAEMCFMIYIRTGDEWGHRDWPVTAVDWHGPLPRLPALKIRIDGNNHRASLKSVILISSYSLKLWDQVSHPIRTPGEIIILRILYNLHTFIYLVRWQMFLTKW
jgi:hypothetical protein